MLMTFDNSALVKKTRREMRDQMKTIDGPDTTCLHISSDSLHYKHLKQNREQIQLHIRVNDAQNIKPVWGRAVHSVYRECLS